MSSIKELREDTQAVATIESITSVYQGIASLRMNQVKDTVARTKTFIDGVAEVYHHAKLAYVASLQRALGGKDKDKLSALKAIKRNGKTAYVFMSANEHLYGSLILDIYHSYLADVMKEGKDSELIIVGSFGKGLLAGSGLANKMLYFELNDDKPSPEEIKKIADFITQYERVILHYGKMRTALTQVPDRLEISGGVDTQGPSGSVKDYLFEPSPEAIIDFFETEIIAALFNQKVFEHQLSRFAARMVAMDQATQNANVITGKLKKDLNNVKKRIANSKQLDVFAGMILWGQK